MFQYTTRRTKKLCCRLVSTRVGYIAGVFCVYTEHWCRDLYLYLHDIHRHTQVAIHTEHWCRDHYLYFYDTHRHVIVDIHTEHWCRDLCIYLHDTHRHVIVDIHTEHWYRDHFLYSTIYTGRPKWTCSPSTCTETFIYIYTLHPGTPHCNNHTEHLHRYLLSICI